MSNEELFKKVEYLLERKLREEECKFLEVAGELLLDPKKTRPQEAIRPTSRVA